MTRDLRLLETLSLRPLALDDAFEAQLRAYGVEDPALRGKRTELV